MHSPAVGSYGGAVSDERGTRVARCDGWVESALHIDNESSAQGEPTKERLHRTARHSQPATNQLGRECTRGRKPPRAHPRPPPPLPVPRPTGRFQLIHRNVQRFRGGLAFKAHGLCLSLNTRLDRTKEEEAKQVISRMLCRVRAIPVGFGFLDLLNYGLRNFSLYRETRHGAFANILLIRPPYLFFFIITLRPRVE